MTLATYISVLNKRHLLVIPQVVTIEEEKGDASTCLARLENFAVRGIRLAMRQRQDEVAAAV